MLPRVILCALILAAFNIQMTSQAFSATLKCSEIKAAFNGKNATFTGSASGKQKYRSNGTTSVSLSNGVKDSGKWWCSKGKVCTKWKKLRNGKTGCFSVTKIGAKKYKSSHGYTMKTN